MTYPLPGPAPEPEYASCFYCGSLVSRTPAGFWSVTGEDTYEIRADIRCEESPNGRHTPDDLGDPDAVDALVSAIAYGILLAAFAEHGVATRRAFDAAWLAVLYSDAFQEASRADSHVS